ncbi:MAG: hypothetical protein WBO58_10015 [Gammaproteobacteria bacterium]
MSWEQVTAADNAYGEALSDLKAAQTATSTALAALNDANLAYETASAAERTAEDTAEIAQAELVAVSASVGVDYPPENAPVVPAVIRR